MAVIQHGGYPSFSNCQLNCESQYNELIQQLDYAVDETGNIYPPNLDLRVDIFNKIPVHAVLNSRYNYDLTFGCSATINVLKVSDEWRVGKILCEQQSRSNT